LAIRFVLRARIKKVKRFAPELMEPAPKAGFYTKKLVQNRQKIFVKTLNLVPSSPANVLRHSDEKKPT
jgi:hypothetical protein